MMTKNNLGRERLDWQPEIWNRIDQAVHAETERTEVASKFLPLYGPLPPGTRTVPADSITLSGPLTVDEGKEVRLSEIFVEFATSKQQYEEEERLRTAVTLATRAANVLAQVKDLLIFQGKDAIPILDDPNGVFAKIVQHRGDPTDGGLSASANDPIPVYPLTNKKKYEESDSGPKVYGENTFKAVVQAYSLLQGLGHYGPYALALYFDIYADTYAPLPTTLIMPADRIKPLVTGGYFGTGTLKPSTGLLVSTGGNTMDLPVGVAATTAFTQVDTAEQYLFRVYERFTLRLKDPTAVVRLEFQ